jgi:hypothetical protein
MGIEEIMFLETDYALNWELQQKALRSGILEGCNGFVASFDMLSANKIYPSEPYVAFSAEGSWSFYMTDDEFGFLCGPPDVLQNFFDHWGGEEVLYQRFVEFDLGRRWWYNIGKVRREPRYAELRDATYRRAGWEAPNMTEEEEWARWPWLNPQWEDPAWRVSQGILGPQIGGHFFSREAAQKKWDAYLEQRDKSPSGEISIFYRAF